MSITELAGSTDTGFASALAVGADWSDAAKNCLAALPSAPGANLGFVYVTDRLADQLSSIVTLFRGVTGIDQWVGTVGLGVCGRGAEVFDRPAIAVLLTTLPAESFRLFPALTDGTAPLDEAAGTWLATRQPLLGLVHADPRTPRLPELIAAVARRSGGFLVGGLCASRGEQAVLAGRVAQGGLSGVLFSDRVALATGLTQGCSPIGPTRTVTDAQDTVIKEIDGRPALEALRHDVGELLAGDLERVAGYVFAGLPIAGSDTGDYLVRNLLGIDPQRGWIAVGEPVAEGRPLLFCRRDRAAAEADLKRMLGQMKRRLGGGTPKGGIYVSCIARGPGLFGDPDHELRAIAGHLGDFPLAGFFAGGEISHDRLYSYTGVLTLFL